VNAARREIERQRDRLNAAFQRAYAVDLDALETRSDLAKYLCIRVSGFLETSIGALVVEYCKGQAGPRVARYVAGDVTKFQNANRQKIIDLLGQFDTGWREDLEEYLCDERGAAVGTIVANRHKIAHGQDSDLTLVQVKRHWEAVQEVVEHIAALLEGGESATLRQRLI